MTLGNRIKERRKELDLTQDDLAKSLKVTPQHISAIEQDKRIPSLNMLVELAKMLGVSTDWLLSGQEGLINDPISAIKALKDLSAKSKKALVSMVEELSTRAT